jgi:hypothetical protein
MSRETQLKLHNVIRKAAFTYRSENWILKKDRKGFEAPNMKFLLPIMRYTRMDREKNTEIGEYLNMPTTVNEIQEY